MVSVNALGYNGLVGLVTLDEAALGQFIATNRPNLIENRVLVECLSDSLETFFTDLLVKLRRSIASRLLWG